MIRKPATDRILINGLTFDCIIGIYAHERTVPQPLRIDLSMTTDLRQAARSGELDHTLNYAEISQKVIQFCQAAKAELIETLAENLAAELLSRYAIDELTLRMLKPQAVPEASSVGLEITRNRPDLPSAVHA